jgi:hypothetical protein
MSAGKFTNWRNGRHNRGKALPMPSEIERLRRALPFYLSDEVGSLRRSRRAGPDANSFGLENTDAGANESARAQNPFE